MGGLREVSARPFDGKIEVHCATYFKIAVVMPRSPESTFPINSSKLDFAHFEKTSIDINDLAFAERYSQAIDFKWKLQKMRKVELSR
jgi:hypothetical protein